MKRDNDGKGVKLPVKENKIFQQIMCLLCNIFYPIFILNHLNESSYIFLKIIQAANLVLIVENFAKEKI